MSMDPKDFFEADVLSDCCQARVLQGGICADCREHCESVPEKEPEPDYDRDLWNSLPKVEQGP